jgi:hypothetical protein
MTGSFDDYEWDGAEWDGASTSEVLRPTHSICIPGEAKWQTGAEAVVITGVAKWQIEITAAEPEC